MRNVKPGNSTGIRIGIGLRQSTVCKSISTLLAVLLCIFVSAGAETDFSKSKKAVIPMTEKAPVIDGRIDAEEWKQASRVTNFLDMARIKKTASEQTEVLMMRDSENLYFAFICDSHDPVKIKADTPKSERDFARIYKDDSINLFIDTENSKNDCYQWIFNVNGAVFDQVLHRLIYTERMLPSREWNSNVEAFGEKGDKKWFLEVKIPLSSFSARDLKALNESKQWGIQFGRENWSLPNGGAENSTWSATYSFVEPESYGTVSFSGMPTVELRQAWVQKIDPSMSLIDAPKRPDYKFARVFDFGPPPEKDEIDANDPKGVLFVDQKTLYSNESGFGFDSIDGLSARRSGNRQFSEKGRLSPLSSDYISSSNPAVFRFQMPADEYQAVIVCGKNIFLGDVGGMDYEITVNDGKARCYNQEAGRVFLPVGVPFKTDGKVPVTMRITPAAGTTWAISAIVVFPKSEYAEANEAFFWLERDFYNYPFEKYVNRTEAWIDIPSGNIKPHISDAEKEKGFAVFGLSPSSFVPASYVPEETDPRDKAVAITSPGFTAGLAVGFHTLRPVKDLRATIGRQPGDGVRVQLLQVEDMLVNVGKISMNQMGWFPKLLGKTEPVWLKQNRTQAYFISTDIAETAAPGVRSGTLELYDGERKLTDFPFEFVILPFSPLNRSSTIRSIFYNPPICSNFAAGKVGREKEDFVTKTRNQLKDLKRHGINAVHVYADGASYKKEADGKWHFRPRENELIFWDLLKKAGIHEYVVTVPILEGMGPVMINDYMERAGHKERVTGMTTRYLCKDKLPPEFFENVSLLIRENLEERAKRGYDQPAFDPWDEPGHMNSEAYVPILDAIRAGGGKTNVQVLAACFPTLTGRVDIKTYDMGSLAVNGGEAESPEQIAALKKKEGSIYTVYPNSTIMGGDSRASRQMFGTFVWAWNLDGADPYKYWKILGDYRLSAGYQQGSFHPMMFDENGDVIHSTPVWENFAEGAYDNDLIQELIYRTANPDPHADQKTKDAARAFIEELRRSTSFHPSFIARGHDSQTAAPKFTRFNWHPSRFEHMRASMAVLIMKLSGLDKQYPDMMQSVEKMERTLKTTVESLRAIQNKDVPDARTENLMTNGDFEALPATASNGWSKFSGFPMVSPNACIQTEVKHSGQKALKFEHVKNAPWDHVRTDFIKLVPGKSYIFNGWAKRDAEKEDVNNWTGFQMRTYKDIPSQSSSTDQFIQRRNLFFGKPSFDWMKIEYPFTPGPSENYVNFVIYNNDTKGVIYIDDLELREYDSN